MDSQDRRDGGAAPQEEVPYIAVIMLVRAFGTVTKGYANKSACPRGFSIFTCNDAATTVKCCISEWPGM